MEHSVLPSRWGFEPSMRAGQAHPRKRPLAVFWTTYVVNCLWHRGRGPAHAADRPWFAWVPLVRCVADWLCGGDDLCHSSGDLQVHLLAGSSADRALLAQKLAVCFSPMRTSATTRLADTKGDRRPVCRSSLSVSAACTAG